MTAHEHHAPTRDETLQAGHELTDAEAAPILRFLVFLAVLTVCLAGLMVFFYNYLASREALEKTARYPMGAGMARPLPPPPRLQSYPFQDIKELRRDEDRLLNNYEWINKNAGTVRIPIARAMEIVAERGLPYRKPGEPAPAPAAAPPSGTATPTGTPSGQQPVSPR
jgi:hypothetical protein